jgi:hypothetical protein
MEELSSPVPQLPFIDHRGDIGADNRGKRLRRSLRHLAGRRELCSRDTSCSLCFLYIGIRVYNVSNTAILAFTLTVALSLDCFFYYSREHSRE